MTLPKRPRAIVPAPLNVRFSKTKSIRHIPAESSAKDPTDLSPPTPGVDDRPFIRFAIDQLTRDEELSGRGRQGSVASTEVPERRIVHDEGLGYFKDGKAQEPSQQEPSSAADHAPHERHRRTELPPRALSPERMVAIHRIPIHCADTGFLPMALRRTPLITTILTICLMIAALILCNVWSLGHDGLTNYTTGSYDARYFLFQYLPQLLGMAVILWLFVIQSTIRRTTPFMRLSDESPADRVLQDMSLVPANFVLPNFTYFRDGETALGLCELTLWLMNFTIPLLSCAFQSKVYRINNQDTWRWTSVQAVIWALVVLYLLLIAALILVMRRFNTRNSNLCWDPVSIADLIPMFQKSNFLPDYDRSEISGSMKTHIPARHLRIGYWRTTKSAEVVYAVGEDGGYVRRYSLDRGSMGEKQAEELDSPPWDVEAQRYSNASQFNRNIHSPFIRYRWAPWFLRDTTIIVWSVAAFALFLAFVIVSFVNQAVQNGFRPLLPTKPNGGGFSSSNFLYSFLSALLGMILFLAWQPIDMYFRNIQPYASLSDPHGATAENSLLLSYPNCLPIETTVLALSAHHYRVAYVSTISLISAMIPILSGGIFTAQYWPNTSPPQSSIRVTADMSVYYLLTVILGIYALSIPFVLWPTRHRYLPHRIDTLADHLSFFYQSGLLRDIAFRQPRSKADLVARLVTMPVGEMDLTGGSRGQRRRAGGDSNNGNARAGGVPRYAFGVYMGRDGREHLGIDRLKRPGSGVMLTSSGTFFRG